LRVEHSRKPDEVRNRIKNLWATYHEIELFAREDNQPTLTGKKLFDGLGHLGK